MQMKLKDLLIDSLNSTRLFEMAYERKKALQHISSLQRTVVVHFVKYFGLDSPQNKNHWLSELNAYFYDLNDLELKPNSRRLGKHDYMNILWEEPLGHGKQAITRIRTGLLHQQYKGVNSTALTDSQIYEILFKIYDTVCADMANDTFLSRGIEYYIQLYGP